MTLDATRLHVACGCERLCIWWRATPPGSFASQSQTSASDLASLPCAAANKYMSAIDTHSRDAMRALVPTLDRVSSWVPRAVGEAGVAYI